MISDKAKKILLLLMQNDQSSLTIKQISSMLNMSTRSVSNYLKEVYEFCAKAEIIIVNKPGTGISVFCGAESDNIIRQVNEQNTINYSADERVKYIINVLLNNHTTYTIALFSEDLSVSKNTVENDLVKVEKYLHSYGIDIIKKSGAGIYIQGSEIDIRKAIVIENRKQNKYCCKGTCQKTDYRVKEQTIKRLSGLYRGYHIEQYITAIQKADYVRTRKLSDRGFEALLEYIIAAHSRIKAGYLIEEEFRQENPDDDPELCKAVNLITKSLNFPECEKKYLGLLIYSMEYQDIPEVTEQMFQNFIPEILELTKQVIKYVSDIMDLDLEDDDLLLKALYCYNRSAKIRIKYGIELLNPFLDEIKKTYPSVFSVCFAAGSIIYKKMIGQEPSENEISNLALLIGGSIIRKNKKVHCVVFSAGGFEMSSMLVRKIEDTVPQLVIDRVINFNQIQELDKIKPQLIISTVEGMNFGYPEVVITPIVCDEDVRKLNRACSDIYTKVGSIIHNISILDFLDNELVFLNYEGDNKEKVLTFMADGLRRKGYVKETFLEDVMNREAIGSTSLGLGVAIPHGLAGNVISPAVSIVTLKNSIDWGNDRIDVIIMLSLDFKDIISTRIFFHSLYKMTSDEKTIQLLRKAKNIDELKNVFRKYFI